MNSEKFSTSNELKIGLTILVAIAIAFVGFRIMRDQPLFRQAKFLYVKFDRVDGLLPGNVVHIKGFKVGSVKELQYLFKEDSTLVTLSITADFNVPKGSKAILKEPGPLGAVTIEIIQSTNSEYIEWGASIDGEIDSGIFGTFADKGEELADKLTKSLKDLNSLLVKVDSSLYSKNKDPINSTLTSFEKIGRDARQLLEKRKADIDSMIVSMSNITQNFDDLTEENKAEIDSMLTNLSIASAELEVLSKNLNKTTTSFNQVLDKINSKEGSLGKMVYDESLYNNLDSLSFNLNELIKNIQKDPKKYLKHMRLIEVF